MTPDRGLVIGDLLDFCVAMFFDFGPLLVGLIGFAFVLRLVSKLFEMLRSDVVMYDIESGEESIEHRAMLDVLDGLDDGFDEADEEFWPDAETIIRCRFCNRRYVGLVCPYCGGE